MTAGKYDVSFGGDENVLKSITMMIAQLGEHTKTHFKGVNCMACELHLNKK